MMTPSGEVIAPVRAADLGLDLEACRRLSRHLQGTWTDAGQLADRLRAPGERDAESPEAEALGYVAAVAVQAADALFDLVNSANAYLDYPGAEALLDRWHNGKEVTPE